MDDQSIEQAPGLLSEKVALLIGASRGIGARTARVLARAGAKVMLAARDEKALEAVVGVIQAEGHEAHFMSLDVGDERSVECLVDATLGAFGRLDIALITHLMGERRNLSPT
ncbi:SDR family NAD(P)-dependent oxidoreductase [Mesorhizobium shangrilense]|uniref:SDR family NAD(P)-dependent oxidoreductase n=1 Tax=Mesorhizobium shangrilense TaxID=460060 RepID=A0ABV2DLT2_9HYPH